MQSAKFPKIFTIEWKTANYSKAKKMSLLSYSWLALKNTVLPDQLVAQKLQLYVAIMKVKNTLPIRKAS